MEVLNDTEGEIFQSTMQKQKNYISQRLEVIKNKILSDSVKLCGSKEEIINHLNHGIAANLVQQFFQKSLSCIWCEGRAGDNGIRQIERAHCGLYKRGDLLEMAVDELYIDEDTPIKTSDILRLFIQKHEICPIYMLCNVCHTKYDSKK